MCPMSPLELLILIIKFITNKLMYFTFIKYLECTRFHARSWQRCCYSHNFSPHFLLYFHEEGSIKKTSRYFKKFKASQCVVPSTTCTMLFKITILLYLFYCAHQGRKVTRYSVCGPEKSHWHHLIRKCRTSDPTQTYWIKHAL